MFSSANVTGRAESISKLNIEECFISTDKSLLLTQMDKLVSMLHTTTYAKEWSKERIQKIIDNSECYGLYTKEKELVEFVKVVTDFELVCYISMFVVDEAYQLQGLGTKLGSYLLNDERLKNCFFVLYCSDKTQQKQFEKHGFRVTNSEFMLLQDDE